MPRTKKATPGQEIETIEQALDTPIEQTIEDAANSLGVDPFRLQEMFVERLGIEEPMTWLTLPLEHESTLEAIKRDMDASASVRRLDPEPEPEAMAMPAEGIAPEVPIIEEEAPKLAKTKAGKLTQKKTEAISKGREASTKTQKGI